MISFEIFNSSLFESTSLYQSQCLIAISPIRGNIKHPFKSNSLVVYCFDQGNGYKKGAKNRLVKYVYWNAH